MMRELIVATGNPGKLREIRALLEDLPLRITGLEDHPGLPPIVEDGTTFRRNACKKASTVARVTGGLVLGEDSGLEVAALDGAPGVYSARFSGPRATDESNNRKLLRSLRGVPWERREARYRCVAALAEGERIVAVVSGSCRGRIALRRKGRHGFGYDPLFWVPRYGRTFGELDPAVKDRISHRARALRRLKAALREHLAGSSRRSS